MSFMKCKNCRSTPYTCRKCKTQCCAHLCIAQDDKGMATCTDCSKKFAGKWSGAEIDPNKRINPVVGYVQRISNGPKPQAGKFMSGGTGKSVQPAYTGSAMLGVATMHKSNSVPVFSQDEAIDLAHMRRN